MKPFLIAGSLALTVGANQPALGQDTLQPAHCDKAALNAPWLAWGNAASPATASQEIAVNQPYLLSLKPSEGLPTSTGEFSFTVKAAGTFRFALEGAAWIDLLRGTSPLKPKSFGHGPNCSGIRKIVDFDLAPGSYTIRISKSPAAKIRLLVITV